MPLRVQQSLIQKAFGTLTNDRLNITHSLKFFERDFLVLQAGEILMAMREWKVYVPSLAAVALLRCVASSRLLRPSPVQRRVYLQNPISRLRIG